MLQADAQHGRAAAADDGMGRLAGDRDAVAFVQPNRDDPDVFVLHMLGYDDLAVYDASMTEWAKDPRLPMEGG